MRKSRIPTAIPVICALLTVFPAGIRTAVGGNSIIERKDLNNLVPYPSDALPVPDGGLFCRRKSSHWEVGRVQRRVWQDIVLLLQTTNRVVGLIEEQSFDDSNRGNTNAGVYVVIKISSEQFATASEAMKQARSERVLREIQNADETLIRIGDFKPPVFTKVELDTK